MNRINALLIILVCLLSIHDANARGEKNSYRMVWKENFRGKSIDHDRWSKIPRGKPDWKRYMSDHESLYGLKGGKLILHGVENKGTAPEDTARFLTGGIFTKGKFAIRYGKVEVRAKLEAAQGVWPAIWMLPERAIGRTPGRLT